MTDECPICGRDRLDRTGPGHGFGVCGGRDDDAVHVGDALQVMRSLPDQSFDLVLTDPPFSSGATREAGKVRNSADSYLRNPGQWFGGDNMSTRAVRALLRDCAIEWFRLLKPGGHVLVFCDWRMLADFSDGIESADLRRQSIVVWDKGSPGMGSVFRKRHEFVLHFTRGQPVAHSRSVSDVIKAKRVHHKERVHPTEKPPSLLLELMRPTVPPGGRVLDCFAGSGTTALAAREHGASVVLIEREPEFAALCRQRARV